MEFLKTFWARLLFRLSAVWMDILNAYAGKSASSTRLPNVAELSPRVWRVLGQNPGMFTLQGTNTYVVGTGKARILIDTGAPNAKYHKVLSGMLKEQGVTELSDILLTHFHGDHTGGVPALRAAFPAARVWKRARPGHGDRHDPRGPYLDVQDEQRFHTEGASLRAMFTPGHSDDHMCFVLEEENAIFAGDNVLGAGTSVFEDLADYTRSLRKLLIPALGRIYPAHGPVVEKGTERVEMYLKHRRDREQQILTALRAHGPRPASCWDLVNEVYKGMPSAVKRAAVMPMTQHLEKCQKEGLVKCVSKAWSKTGYKYQMCEVNSIEHKS